MTVAASTAKYVYVGDGSSVAFPFSSLFFLDTDILVGVNGLEQTSGFSVTGAGNPSGGTVTFSTAPAAGAIVVLLRKPSFQQLVDFVNGSTVLEGTLEPALDRLTMMSQYLLDAVTRSVRVGDVDTQTATEDLLLPSATARADKIVGFDTLGQLAMYTREGVGPTYSLEHFSTRADLAAATVPNDVTRVRVHSYDALTPDGGATYYRKVAGETAFPGDLQDAAGAWWSIAETEVDPRMFGAKADHKVVLVNTVAGSTTVQAPGDPVFTAADVGKNITINTASGESVRRMIAAYVSATQVTVDASIPSTATGTIAYFATMATTAFQACLDFAKVKLTSIALKAGVFVVSTLAYADAPLVMTGAGPEASYVVLDSPTGSLNLRTSGSPYAIPHQGLFLSNLSIWSSFDTNTAAALVDYSTTMSGSPRRYVTLNNLNVGSFGRGFNCGVWLDDASNYVIRDTIISNSVINFPTLELLAGGIGLKVTGNTKPIDMYSFGLRVYFCDTACKIEGATTFPEVMEAVVFSGCTLIVNNVNIDFQSATPTPHLSVTGCNLNAFKNNIVGLNIIQLKLTDNLFYSVERAPAETFWTSIDINYTSAASTNAINNTIIGNTFIGDNTPNTSRVGISINSTVPKNVTTIISANYFAGMEYSLIAYANVTGVKMDDTNTFDRVANRPLFQTRAGNIDGSAVVGQNGSIGLNGGQTIRYGRITANVGAGNRVTVTYPTAFASATHAVSVSIETAALANIHAEDSKTAAGFQIYVPGITPGASITFTYIAIGE